MNRLFFLLVLLLPEAWAAQPPVIRSPFTTNYPVELGKIGTIQVTTNAAVASLTVTNAAQVGSLSAITNVTTAQVTATNRLVVSGATVTANAPALSLTQTWNDAGVTFEGITLDVTDTASAAASELLDLRVGGSTKAYINKSGVVRIASGGSFAVTADTVAITGNRSGIFFDSGSGANLYLQGKLAFSRTGVDVGGATDLVVERDAAGTLAQRNGTTAQTNRLYSTYTDTSNYERYSLEAGDTALTLKAETAGTGDDNLSIVVQPVGTGAFYLDNAAATAGNARGTKAVDLQMDRDGATKVASGQSSFAAGALNTVSGNYAGAIGYSQTVSGVAAFAAGSANTASANWSFATGQEAQATADHAIATGKNAVANKAGQLARGSGIFLAAGDAQWSVLTARRSFTVDGASGSVITNTWGELFLDGNTASARCTVPANTTWAFKVTVVVRGTAGGTGNELGGHYTAVGTIERDGASNTALIGSVTYTAVAEEDTDWDVQVTANDTNEALKVEFYPDDDICRAVAKIELVEVGG